MDVINLLLIGIAGFCFAVYFELRKSSRPPKCPKCGKRLNVYYDKETNVFSCNCECGYNYKI